LSIIRFAGGNIYEKLRGEYDFLKTYNDAATVEAAISKNAPTLKLLGDQFVASQIQALSLTSVGQLIALINLGRVLPGIDYTIWLK